MVPPLSKIILAPMLNLTQFCLLAAGTTIIFVILNVVLLLNVPVLKRILIDRMVKISTLKYDNFRDSFLGLEMLKTCFKQFWLTSFMSIRKGCIINAENYVVCRVSSSSREGTSDGMDAADGVDLNANYEGSVEQKKSITKNFIDLGIMARKGVPLVLNFGSCS